MTLPGAETIKGGIIGVDFLRLSLGVSLELEELLLPLPFVLPFAYPFAFTSIPRRKPLRGLDMSEHELSGVVGIQVISCDRGALVKGPVPN
jgi:hypothetical protein